MPYVVDNRNSLNLILVNPVNEKPYLCLIKDQQYLGKIHSSAPIDIHEWNRIKIELEYKNDTLYVRNNGSLISKEKLPPRIIILLKSVLVLIN